MGKIDKTEKKIPLYRRISTRIMLFNPLLIFLPIGAFVYFQNYDVQMLIDRHLTAAEQTRWLAMELSREEYHTYSEDDFERLPILLPSQRIVILDKDKKIIHDTGWKNNDRYFSQYTELPRALRDLIEFSELRAFDPSIAFEVFEKEHISRSLKGQILTGEVIKNSSGIIGAVLIFTTTEDIRIHGRYMKLFSALIFALSLVCAVVLSLITSYTIIKPLSRLKNGAALFKYRKFTDRDPFQGIRIHDEIGDLADSFREVLKALAERTKASEQFADDIAHELKNPITSIRSSFEMFHLAKNPNDKDEFSEMIFSDLQKMTGLLDQIRDLGKINVLDRANSIDNKENRCDLIALIPYILERCKEKEINVSLPDGAEYLFIPLSPLRFTQAVFNILDNAVSFSPGKGTIDLEIYLSTGSDRDSSEKTVSIEIGDKGPGVSQDSIDTIFDRFYTFRPENHKEPHSGLGLAIVKAIVESCGGKIMCKNKKTGGALFIIKLPVLFC